MAILIELACGKTSSPCNRKAFPSVKSRTATPSTPSNCLSTAAIDASSFPQRISRFCSVFSGQHAAVWAWAARTSEKIMPNVATFARNSLLLHPIDINASQPCSGGLGCHRSVVHLFEGVGFRAASRQDRQDLDVPVVVF